MPRAKKLGDLAYNYVLDQLKTIHEQLNTPTVVKWNFPRYTSVSEIIRSVLEDPVFFDVDDYKNGKIPTEDQIEISKGTIRGAVNRLIADKKISLVDGYWEYTPNDKTEINDIPILGIADKTKITINIPESFLILTVKSGLANSVSEYLSAQFYKGDIIFLPVGNYVVCISTLPESIVVDGEAKDTSSDISPADKLLYRIKSVLHSFKLEYPQFSYGLNYESAYTAFHNPEVNADIREMAFDHQRNKFSYHRYMLLMKMCKSLPWLEEYQTLSKIFGPLSTDHDGIDDDEWDLMDSSIMQEVDDEIPED